MAYEGIVVTVSSAQGAANAVLLPRKTSLSAIHVGNMLPDEIDRIFGLLRPVMENPKTRVESLPPLAPPAARILDLLGVQHELTECWR